LLEKKLFFVKQKLSTAQTELLKAYINVFIHEKSLVFESV